MNTEQKLQIAKDLLERANAFIDYIKVDEGEIDDNNLEKDISNFLMLILEDEEDDQILRNSDIRYK
jgi:hypothetical protein